MAPVTAAAIGVPPGADVTGADVTGTVQLAADWRPAASASAGAYQSGVPALSASRATAGERGSCCDGLCSSRQPRQGSVSATAVSSVSAVLLQVKALVAPCRTVAPRTLRPPGRPDLPLPLFLGVSRT
jgi:hypothetical protein